MKKHALPPIPDFSALCACATEPDHAAPSDAPRFFDTALQAVTSLAPTGSTVLAIGFDNTEKFSRAGYRVVAENADITIARGGAEEFVAARKRASRLLVLCPTRDYAAAATAAYLDYDGAFGVVKRGKLPDAAVFDKTDVPNLAAAFGEIAAVDLSAFDYSFGKMLRGERTATNISNEAAELVRDTTESLRGREKDSAYAAEIIVKAGSRAAELSRKAPDMLYSSGAAQTAQALKMLCRNERREVCSRGEAEMLLTRYVVDFYIKNLCTKPPLFPPDATRRADSICKYLGGDVVRTCAYASPILTPERLRLYEYRCREFGGEYMRTLAEIRERQNNAFEVFKRLYPDDGYRLKTMIDPIDIGICTALAPDVFPADSMLTFFKHTGKLEKYLI